MVFGTVYVFQHLKLAVTGVIYSASFVLFLILPWGRMFQGAFEHFGLDRRGHGGWFDVFVCPLCLIQQTRGD
jgi:hypothetical protein